MGGMADTGDELICPVSRLRFKSTVVRISHLPPPDTSDIQFLPENLTKTFVDDMVVEHGPSCYTLNMSRKMILNKREL